MSELEVCRVCGNTAFIEESVTTLLGFNLDREQWKFYCSKVCRYKDNWETVKYFSYVFFLFSIAFILPGPETLGFAAIFAFLGLIFYMIAHSQKNYAERGEPVNRNTNFQNRKGRRINRKRKKSRKKIITHTPISKDDEGGIVTDDSFDPQDQLIYSDILQAEVHPCCHQSARLNDKYCACGRALVYPSQN